MKYDDIILRKITNFGALQYSAERICRLIGLTGDEATQLLNDLYTPDSEPYKAYKRGIAIGDYNIDSALMKACEGGDVLAESTLRERQERRRIDDLKKELFGI
ncbi:MAG: hypothetical protein EGP82_01980 [Odoribacter splanchnicus]|nr:hypothetical protein [Odoribacter splanchnicus]